MSKCKIPIAMSSDVECIKCRNKLKRRKTAQKRCPKRKLAAPALDNDPLSDSDNDLTSTVREFIDSMKKMNHRVYEKVIILEEEIISLKKIIAEGCMENRPDTTAPPQTPHQTPPMRKLPPKM